MDRAIRIPPNIPQTNNAAELIAILEAVRMFTKTTPLNILTDSKLAMAAVTTQMETQEDTNWIGYKNAEIIPPLLVELRKREAPTTFSLEKEEPDRIDLNVLEGEAYSGARLEAMTQSTLYKGILAFENKNTERESTGLNLERMRSTMEERSNVQFQDEAIWKSLRNKNIPSKKISTFLWKTIHAAHACGKFWEKMMGLEEQAVCPECRETESIEHILIDCIALQNSNLWEQADELLRKAGWPDHKTEYGDVLGCALILPKKDKETRDPSQKGRNRLRTILISETAYLIWRMRCEWIIDKEADPSRKPSRAEAKRRWQKTIQARLDLDILATNSRRYEKKARKTAQVLDTWQNVVECRETLKQSVKQHRNRGVVLVGNAHPERPQGQPG
ncbi:hypothetical protein BKA70DRAFT_1424541 [Coprinopsis sp. MPI-PUGE-AT-0042]|nr:hypothetical protein BKA70DRAFT_1424541 [Coprinopsis sp. MPI-PUGE-AT-0042]